MEYIGNINSGVYCGVTTGEWKFYHNNGKLESFGKLENNKKTGEWKIYDKDGEYIKTENHN